jgi:hypothetical protein
MNPVLRRYLPPALVLASALFFAWPPSKPLDLGDDVVKATSVRWRPQDLADPPPVTSTRDPFEDLAVAIEEVNVNDVITEIRPLGPDVETLKSGLQLEGIAKVGGQTWAVLNGRPRLQGDFVHTNDANRHRCKIVSIHSDHIVVRCEETLTELRTRDSQTAAPSASRDVPAATGGFAPQTTRRAAKLPRAASTARDANADPLQRTRP